MRSSKPLILQRSKPNRLILGSSRAARLSPLRVGRTDVYNSSIPGATPSEIRELLEFSHHNQPVDFAIIGWDFEAFLGHNPSSRDGFNSAFLQARNPASRLIESVKAHKRALFSFVALRESLRASEAKESALKPAYFPDGSWQRRNRKLIGPFFFSMTTKEKLNTFSRQGAASIDTRELNTTLEICYAEKIDCRIFVTPVHLFHLEVFRQAKLIPLWKHWHEKLVTINVALAEQYAVEPLPVWGFNAVLPAVNEPIKVRRDLSAPWFSDNIHFRPRFGDVILEAMLATQSDAVNGASIRDGARVLTPANIDAYLAQVLQLERAYVLADKVTVGSLREKINF